MGRLIDADAIVEYVRKYSPISDGADLLETWLEYAPTVDAVPVDDVFALAIALNKEIEVLGLSVRAYHALSRRACRTVGDVYRLLKSGEIKKVRNLGDKSIGEIEDRLCEYLPYLWRTEGR